ncbi:MAG: hypothetical protein ACYDEV_08585 [Acidiferrobacter sp.]
MKRTATPTFVITIPLVAKPGEDRILIGRMEAGRRLYNATLGEALRRHGLLKQSRDWQRYMAIRTPYAEVERKLAAERKRAHGELAHPILGLGHVISSETLSYLAFQKNYGKSVKVRAPGMFVE